jgi:hypothetical protein
LSAHPTPKKHLAFYVIMAIGVLLAAEALLRVLALSSRSVNALLSVDPVHSYLADRALLWRGNPEYPEHDRLGFRNPDVPSQVSIVALGDSQTYGARVSRDQAWPQQLQRAEKSPTYNMAFPGWGPPQSLLVLDQAIEMNPRLIIEAVYTGNDLVNSFTFVYRKKRLTRLRSTDEQVLQSIGAAEKANDWDDNGLVDQDPIDASKSRKGQDRRGSIGERIAAQSELYGLWNALNRAAAYYARRPATSELDDEADSATSGEALRFENAWFKTMLSPGYRLTAVKLADPRVQEGLRITVDVLSQMHEQCAAANVHFAVLLVPTKELALREAAYAELAEVPPTYTTMVEDEDDVRRALREQLTARQVPFVDALPTLSALARDGDLPYSETKDGHLNALGHRAVAELVRSAIEQQKLLSASRGS